MYVRGSWRPNITAIFWPPLLWPSTLCLSRSPGAQGPTLLGDGFLYCILSATSLDPTQSGASSPFGLVWLSLPHLVYNSVRTPTVLTELYNSSTSTQSPTRSLNRMFDRYQAEITVTQFIGHSLLVHQSMSVPWEFFTTSHFISQIPPTRFPLITAIRMCHFLPVHHLGMAFLARSKVKIQHLHVLLFNTNYYIQHNSFTCTQLNSSKYYYVSLTILLNISHLFTHIKWSNSSIFNNQFSITNLFALGLNVKQFYLTKR